MRMTPQERAEKIARSFPQDTPIQHSQVKERIAAQIEEAEREATEQAWIDARLMIKAEKEHSYDTAKEQAAKLAKETVWGWQDYTGKSTLEALLTQRIRAMKPEEK